MGKKVKVVSKDLYGHTCIYKSFSAAGKAVGVSPSSIRNCALGKKPTAAGKVWRLEGKEFEPASLAKLIPTAQQFLTKSLEVHGNKYTYLELPTIWKDVITILCNKCGKTFKQQASNHRYGNGCPQCASSGFKSYLPAILYYLRVEYNGMVAYKIGITNRTVNERYSRNHKGSILILKQWDFSKGADAMVREAEILNDFKVYAWKGIEMLSDGNSELFDRDILELEELYE